MVAWGLRPAKGLGTGAAADMCNRSIPEADEIVAVCHSARIVNTFDPRDVT